MSPCSPRDAKPRWTNQCGESQSDATVPGICKLPSQVCSPSGWRVWAIATTHQQGSRLGVGETPPRCIWLWQTTGGRLSCLTLLRCEPTCHHWMRSVAPGLPASLKQTTNCNDLEWQEVEPLIESIGRPVTKLECTMGCCTKVIKLLFQLDYVKKWWSEIMQDINDKLVEDGPKMLCFALVWASNHGSS